MRQTSDALVKALLDEAAEHQVKALPAVAKREVGEVEADAGELIAEALAVLTAPARAGLGAFGRLVEPPAPGRRLASEATGRRLTNADEPRRRTFCSRPPGFLFYQYILSASCTCLGELALRRRGHAIPFPLIQGDDPEPVQRQRPLQL